MQDHGFVPPYGSNYLLIINFLYAYIKTSTLKDILSNWDTADINDRRRTQHTEDQHGLMKLAQVTLYWTHGDFDFWQFDKRNSFFFQVGRMKFLKTILTGSPALSFSLPDPACSWSRLSPAHFYDRSHWPRACNRLLCISLPIYHLITNMCL